MNGTLTSRRTERGPLFVDNLVELTLTVAFVCGLIKGAFDDRPSFWRGFGEGLAGKSDFRGETYVFFHDRHTGLGIGTRLDD